MIAGRGMNNEEKAAAAELRKAGFTIFWFESGPSSSGYYAIHAKLICQYSIPDMANEALDHLKTKIDTLKEVPQLQLF